MAASEEDLKTAHQRYNEALKLKSNRLPELDKWYREDLPALIKGRGNDAHLTTSELVKLMKWKLTRGKFRPRLEQMAQSNGNELVKSHTKKAFELLRKSDSIDTAKESLLVLNTFKGIGPATSSAILALICPGTLPFMSDEGLEHAAGLKGKPKYSVSEWKWYADAMRQRQAKERWEGGVQQIEEAAWAYAVLTKNGVWKSEEEVSRKRMKRDHA